MKHEIEFFEDEHIYLVDGEEVPSVTTILNYMSDVEYGEINQSVLQTASRRGSLVHEYTQLIDYDYELDEIEGEVVGYLRAYKDFIRDYKPNWLYIEDPVYSEKYGYVGTMDRFGLIDGTHCVLDIKTVSSPTKIQKFTTSSQTMAYRQAVTETHGAFGIINRYALYLNKDGEYNLVDLREYDKKYGYDSWEMFTQCLTMYNKIKELKELKPIKKGKK